MLCLSLAHEYIDRDGALHPINMANSLAISRDGRVFFTQTSRRHRLKNLMLEFAEARGNGLLLSLDHYAAPGVARIVVDGLVAFNSAIVALCRQPLSLARAQSLWRALSTCTHT